LDIAQDERAEGDQRDIAKGGYAMKKTPWFSGDQKPARVGVYEREYGDYGVFSFWDGGWWCSGETTPDKALSRAMSRSWYGAVKWRGLARKP
jgi:hypothetical protein